LIVNWVIIVTLRLSCWSWFVETYTSIPFSQNLGFSTKS